MRPRKIVQYTLALLVSVLAIIILIIALRPSPPYTEITIRELLNADPNSYGFGSVINLNGLGSDGPTIKNSIVVKGTILQKAIAMEAMPNFPLSPSRLIEIEDDGVVALLQFNMSNLPEIYDRLQVGQNVIVTGGLSNIRHWCGPGGRALDPVCKVFNIDQLSVPGIVPFLANDAPMFPGRESVEVE